MLLEDNDIGGICKEPAPVHALVQASSSHLNLGPILAGTTSPLVLAIALLVVIIFILFLKLRRIR